jgi:hypothetical protein
MMDKLQAEFKFNYDPAPFPRPEGYDGLTADWGSMSWVNPLFGSGITAWVRKALLEQSKGKSSVLILPLDNWVRLLIDSKAEIRSLGSHNWVNPITGDQRKSSRPSFLFILRAKQ